MLAGLILGTLAGAGNGIAQGADSSLRVTIKEVAIAGLTPGSLSLVVRVSQHGMDGRLVTVSIAPYGGLGDLYFSYAPGSNSISKRLGPGETEFTWEGIYVTGKGRTRMRVAVTACGDEKNPSCDGVEVAGERESGVILFR